MVAIIAGVAASETEGVASMSGGITEGFARRVSGKNVTKGVSVEVGSVEAAIDLRVHRQIRRENSRGARKLQENVKEAVETMTGLRVVEVEREGGGRRISGKHGPFREGKAGRRAAIEIEPNGDDHGRYIIWWPWTVRN